MERGKGLQNCQVEDRDTANVPLHAPKDRGTCLHLLCGIESVQGVGEAAQTQPYQHECGQGSQHGKDGDYHQYLYAREQGALRQDNADEKA